jgi:hypothetical protein
VRAELIEEANTVGSEQFLTTPDTTPDIKKTPSTRNSRPLKRTYAVAGQQQHPRHKEKADHHPLDLADFSIAIPRATKWTKFSKLDRMKKPGLSEAEFGGLFVKCDNCQRVTTREVFRYHLEDCIGDQNGGDTDTSESDG